jgi:tRNA uridine 5-carbamoylmethylation protein Kti12
MIYILYGQPGSGKTTLGKMLAEHLDTPFIIDGDEFREMFTNKNYGKAGREENIKNANAVATYLNKKGKGGEWKAIYVDVINGWKSHPINQETHVVLSLVNPYDHLRGELKNNNKNQVTEVLLKSNRGLRKEYHVENFEVGNPHYIIDTDKDIGDTWVQLKDLLRV